MRATARHIRQTRDISHHTTAVPRDLLVTTRWTHRSQSNWCARGTQVVEKALGSWRRAPLKARRSDGGFGERSLPRRSRYCAGRPLRPRASRQADVAAASPDRASRACRSRAAGQRRRLRSFGSASARSPRRALGQLHSVWAMSCAAAALTAPSMHRAVEPEQVHTRMPSISSCTCSITLEQIGRRGLESSAWVGDCALRVC